MRKSVLFSLVVICVCSGAMVSNVSAQTFEWSVVAHVVSVEATNMPDYFVVTIDQATVPTTGTTVPALPEGTLLACGPTELPGSDDLEAVKANYALFLAAVSSGHQVRLYGTNANGNTMGLISRVYLLNSY